MKFPVKLRDILRFEKENESKDISVSVYGAHEWKDKKSKKKNFIPQDQCPDYTESTTSDGEIESDPEEEMTEDDRQFLDDGEIEDNVPCTGKLKTI